MAQQARHKLQLFANTHNFLDFKVVLFGKANKALFCPKRFVVNIQDA